MLPRSLRYGPLAVAVWLYSTSSLLAQYDSLLPYVPSTANVLVAINLDQILNSDKGIQKNWKQHTAVAFAEGAVRLPADAKQIVIAAEMDFAHRENTWETSAMQTADRWTDDKLVRAARGYLDPLAGFHAAWSPFNRYLVRLDDFCVGTYSPANRQLASRWANSRRQGPLAPFLERIIRRSETKDFPAMIALDLHDALDDEEWARHLQMSQTVKAHQVTAKSLAASLASLEGAILWIDIGEPSRARLQFEFGADVSAAGPYAKPLLLELLALYGAQIDELNAWQIDVVANAVRLEGSMSEGMLHRVFSFVRIHPPTDDRALAQPGSSQAETTIRQFKTVAALLNDLKLQWDPNEQLKTKDNGELATISVWASKYAGRIEDMPTADVPASFVAYRLEVGRLLRRLSKAAGYGKGALIAGDYNPEKDRAAIRTATRKICKEMSDEFQVAF